jgi:uncharacterized repeat protein (TIGR01451 family)
MIVEKGKKFRAWLFWSGVIPVCIFVAVLFAVHLPLSQALAPSTAGSDLSAGLWQESTGVSSGESVTQTIFLPLIYSNFTFAHLSLVKSAFPASVIVGSGQVVTYTVTIVNEGDTTGKLLAVNDALPAGFTFLEMAPGSDVIALPVGVAGTISWSGPWTMAPGQQLRLVYRVTPSETPGQYINSVSITAQDATLPLQPASVEIVVQPPVLLQEAFDNGIDLWTPFLNHHRLEPGQWYWGAGDGYRASGALTHDCCTGEKVASDAVMMYLQPGAEDWTNYRVETRMLLRGGVDNRGNPEPNTGDPIGLWIRGHYQDSPYESQWISGYYVVLVGRAGSVSHFVRIAKIQEPGDCDACDKPERMYNFDNPIAKIRSEDLPGPFEHFRWYKLAVEVRDANIKVYLDDALVLDWTDPTLPYLSGTVGFKVHETQTASFDDMIVTPLPGVGPGN